MRPRLGAGAKMAERVPTTIARIPAMNAAPLLGALFGRKGRVQQSDVLAKGCVKQADHLRSEADLRYKQNSRKPSFKHAFHRFKINSGLA